MDIDEANRQADVLVQQGVNLLTREITIPNYGGVSTKGARTELTRASATRDATSRVIDNETTKAAESTAREAVALRGMGQADADKALADQAKAQSIADMNQRFAELFGVSGDSSSDAAILMQRLRPEREKAQQLLAKLQKDQSIGLLDNPLDWLVNQINNPARVDEYNRQADSVNTMQSILDTSVATAAAYMQFNEKSIPTVTTAQAVATAAKAKAGAEKLVEDANQALAKQNVDFATKKMANDISLASATINTTQLEMQNAHAVYASKIQAIQLTETHAARLLKAADLLETIERKHDARESTKAVQVLLDNYDTITGHPKGTTTKYMFDKLPSAARENIVGIASGSIGAGPYTALENFQRARPGPEIAPNTLKFFQFLADQAKTINKTDVTANTPKELVSEKLDQILRQKVGAELALAYKPGNTFYELSPAEMINSEAVGSNTQLAKILEPLTKQPGAVPTTFVVEAIMKEYQNPTEAGAIIASYYKKNMQLRNSSMNTRSGGIALVETYEVPLRVGAIAEKSFDLADPAGATKYVLMKQVQDRLMSLRSGNSTVGQFQQQYPEGAGAEVSRIRKTK